MLQVPKTDTSHHQCQHLLMEQNSKMSMQMNSSICPLMDCDFRCSRLVQNSNRKNIQLTKVLAIIESQNLSDKLSLSILSQCQGFFDLDNSQVWLDGNKPFVFFGIFVPIDFGDHVV